MKKILWPFTTSTDLQNRRQETIFHSLRRVATDTITQSRYHTIGATFIITPKKPLQVPVYGYLRSLGSAPLSFWITPTIVRQSAPLSFETSRSSFQWATGPLSFVWNQQFQRGSVPLSIGTSYAAFIRTMGAHLYSLPHQKSRSYLFSERTGQCLQQPC